MEVPTERSPLLPRESETLASAASESDTETFVTSLRRNSSSYLPPYHEDAESSDQPVSATAIWIVVPISLLGVFVANADGSLVVASSQQIASEFNALSNASWLVTSYILAQCASQPLYGKLADIFGRKPNLAVSYTFFAAGCFLCGIGQSYWVILSGRAISGIGGAGMTALVSVIIADMVPVRQVASWRSYVNVAATIGRAMGGPIGGWLCDTVGWRWCFYGQVPLTILGLVLILWKMPSRQQLKGQEKASFQRVDVLGAISLASSISAFLLTLDFGSKDLPSYFTWTAAGTFVLCSFIFYIVESRIAKEPVLPLRLIVRRAPLTSYLLSGLQMAAQFGLFYSVPIYFQLSSDANVTQAGLHLVPAVVGNTTAGLLSGYIISHTGRYKTLTIAASAVACAGYTLVLLRWHGRTGWLETLYLYLGGFGSGTMQSTTFIHIAASLDKKDMSIAGTTLYLSQNLFLLIGVQLSTAVLQARLRIRLNTGLKGVKHKLKIIARALSNVQSIRSLPPDVKHVVVNAYVDGLTWTYGLSVIFAFLGLIAGLTIKERKLEG